MRTVKTTVKCDGCKALVREDSPADPEYLKLRMVCHGYGLMDGDHRERWDICSPECGIKLLRKFIKELEAVT